MISKEILEHSTKKTYSHSSGPGGQHMNKSSTKVQLSFDISGSSLSEEVKTKLMRVYPSGEIHVYNQERRSQHQNEEVAFEHLQELIEIALLPDRQRKITKAPHLTRIGRWKKMLKDRLRKYRERKCSSP